MRPSHIQLVPDWESNKSFGLHVDCFLDTIILLVVTNAKTSERHGSRPERDDVPWPR
jgi:hypothetical protein